MAIDQATSFSIALKAFALWLAILPLAILNGVVREALLVPALGSYGAFIASGAVLSACIIAVAWFGAPWYGRLRQAQWLQIGVGWLFLTLLFEFGFGRFVQHKGWAELLQAYAFKDGNIWPLVLLVTLAAPWLTARWRNLA